MQIVGRPVVIGGKSYLLGDLPRIGVVIYVAVGVGGRGVGGSFGDVGNFVSNVEYGRAQLFV